MHQWEKWEVFAVPYTQHPFIFFFFRDLSIILQSYFVQWLLNPAISLERKLSLINNNCSYHWSYLIVRYSYLQSDVCSITVCILKYNFIWVKCSHLRLQNYVHSRICCKRSQPRLFWRQTYLLYLLHSC